MEGIAKELKGMLARKVLPEVCPRSKEHGKPFHMMLDEKGNKYCPLCELERLTSPELKKMQDEVKTRRYRGYLRENSLVDRTDVFECTFDNFKVKPGSTEEEKLLLAKRIAAFYYENPTKKGDSLLFGNAGSGKTHLAMSILNTVNKYSKNPMQKCLFISVPKLVKARLDYQADPVTNIWSAKHTTKAIQKADLVVIDDLGAESAGKEASRFVQDELQSVYDSNQRIITTSNLSMNELRATYHDRIISRALEGSYKKLIDFTDVNDKRKWL